MKLVTILLLVAAALVAAKPAIDFNIINKVNSMNGVGWRAGVNTRFIGMTMEDVKGLLGAYKGGVELPFVEHTPEQIAATPEDYDTRDQWKAKCPSTDVIRDQANCGSCWAFGAVEAMTDRRCIWKQGAEDIPLSAADMLSCCGFWCGSGCQGGTLSGAWTYWVNHGLVSGGLYDDKTTCYPYQLPSCDHHLNDTKNPCPAVVPTPACVEKCVNGKDFASDKHYGAKAYAVKDNEEAVRTEIYTNGPIEGAFDVYEDFLSYKSGVYRQTWGEYLGGHAIKILGFGVEKDGTKYWTVANSWNPNWGDKGYFKILRGTDECGIDSQGYAGTPKN
jgi:cathepsin B